MDWTYNTIWMDQLPEGVFERVIFGKKSSNWIVPSHASYYIVNDFKPKNKCFSELSGLSSPKYLSFVHSNIHSFEGIANFGEIKRLELFHCVKLERDEGISGLKNSIEWLHIDTSRKFVFSEELYSLKKLKVLCLNDCGAIDNLEFLFNFPDLVDFRFVNTSIIDGNLKLLFEHPNLKSVGFLNKRHYNVKEDEVDFYYKNKSEAEKEYVYKGSYRTFRYKIFK